MLITTIIAIIIAIISTASAIYWYIKAKNVSKTLEETIGELSNIYSPKENKED